MVKKPLKRLKKVVSERRSRKNWKWHQDINPDGVYKPYKKRVRKRKSKEIYG